eukprot:jgi/Ulvmu1/9489/UM052_0059.1
MTFLSRPFSSFLHALEDGSASQVQSSIDECLPYLENLLVFKEKSQDSRSKLDSNAAPFAEHNLSEGDKANARTLSDALNLSEELCVELLLRAHTEGRPVTVEHAAHIYFDERSSLLQAFIRMLHIHLGYMSTSDLDCKDLVEQTLQYLTKPATANGSSKTAPLKRLCAIVKDTTFNNPPQAIPTLEDERSGALPFHHFPAAEQALAAQATFLLAAAGVGPRATAAEAQELLTLLAKADETVAASAQHGHSTASGTELLMGLFPLAAFAVVTMPPWVPEQRPADDEGFKALVQSKELAAAVAGLKDGGSGVAPVARLAFGVALASLHDALDGFEDGKGATSLVAAAVDAGALQHLARFAETPCVRDTWPGIRERISATLLHLALRYADIYVIEYHQASDAIRSANAWVSGATTATPSSPSGHAGPSTALMLAPFAGPSASDAVLARRDTPATLMHAVAVLLSEVGGGAAVAAGGDRLAPDLPPAALEAFVAFVRFAGRTPELANAADEDEAVHGFGAGLETVAARTAYLELMRAYAKDPWSAQQTALQLRDNRTFEGYRQLTWHAAYRRLMLLHDVFRTVADDVTAEPPVATREEAADIEEAAAMAVPFMDLMRVVVVQSRAAGEAQVRATRETLRAAYEECLSGVAGTPVATGMPASPEELLIQVMSFAVPTRLKASLDGALAAHVAAPSDARALLRRVAATALVDRNRTASNLAAQLARHSGAPAGGGTLEEMTAYVRLMNRIVATGGSQLVAAEVDTLMPHMEFILTQLLAPIGKRRYASPTYQCHLAAACVRHLTLSIRCYAAAAGDPSSHLFSDPAAPHTGATALGHLLSPSSPLLRELFTHVLRASPTLETTAVERLTALRAGDAGGRAAEAAVAALFELLLTIFDLDGKWVLLQKGMHVLVETLDTLLLASPAVAMQLIQFVRYDYSPWLQAAAVRVAGTLAARDASVTATLLTFGDEAAALVHSFAGCLGSRVVVPLDPDVDDEWEEGMELGRPREGADGGTEGDGEEKMEIRGLILQLMLDCADMPFPNFTQLLLGYHVSGATDHLAAGPLPHAPSCMSALEAILSSAYLAHSCAPPFKASWQVVHAFATARSDGDALLRHLATSGTLAAALRSPLWAIEVSTYAGDAARVLYCKAWILGTTAMLLLAYDATLSDLPEREGTRDVVRSMLEASAAAAGVAGRTRSRLPAASQLRSTLLTSLQDVQAITVSDLSSAWADEQVAPEDVQSLGLAAVLDSTMPLEAGGLLCYDSVHSVWLYEAEAVHARLHSLKDAYMQRGDARQEEDVSRKDCALVATLNQSARWNESQLTLGGCTFLAQAWAAAVQVACLQRWDLCVAATAPTSATRGAALLPLLHELLISALARAEALCRHVPRAAPVGLRPGAPTAAILQLLQCAQSLIWTLSQRQGGALEGGGTGAPPPRVARETTTLLLKAARAAHDNSHLLDDRAEILAAVHACLLSHLSTCRPDDSAGPPRSLPQSPFGMPSPPPSAGAAGTLRSAAADAQHANAEALQSQGLGLALARNMRKQLDSTLAAAAASVDTGTAADAALTITQAAQHTVALHALAALLATEAAAGATAGEVGGALSAEGVLGAVLESLGAGTPLRLHNAPAVVRQSLRLTEAHFLFIQTFATPVNPAQRAARSRDLLSKGVFAAVARSGILHLRSPPPTTTAAAELHGALSMLRAAALRALLAVALQLAGNRAAMHELTRLLAAPEQGCLGERAADILKASQAHRAHGADVAQAEHLTALLAMVYPHYASLDPALRAALFKRRDDVLDTLATLCRRAAAERGSAAAGGSGAMLALPAPGTQGLPATSGLSRASDPPLTLPPASPLSQQPLQSSAPRTPGAGSVLVLRTQGFNDSAGAAAAPSPLPWRLVLQAAEMLCVALSGASGEAQHALRLWPPGQSSAAAQLQSRQGDYFDVGLILDLVSALYDQFRPLAHAHAAASRNNLELSSSGAGAPPRTPPLAGRPAAAAPVGAGGHAARQRHLCCQLAERAFAVVLLCLQQREAALLEASAAGAGAGAAPSLTDAHRDTLRGFLQRSATAVDEWAELVRPGDPLMGVLRAQRECSARIQSHFRSHS